VEKPITTDAQAHDLYLKGRFHWNKRKVADIRKALDYFQLAVERDPKFALAWAAIAETYVVLPTYDTTVMSRDAYPKARQAAERALQIDQGIAEAHAALAGVFFEYEWDTAAAEREFKKAIELKPNYAAAHYWYADYLAAQFRYDEALQHSKAAREADPLSLVALASLPFHLMQQGDYDGALREIRPLEELEPEDWRISVIHSEVALAKGDRDEALKHLAKLAESGDERGRLGWLLVSGQRAEAEALAKTLANLASENKYSAYRVAMAYASLEDVDETVRWLKHAHAIRSADLRYIKRDSVFDRFYDDPQFLAALKNMGFNEKLPKRLQAHSRLAASPERGH
jgi:tetratricopeptide (TPR) repeat protein